MIRPDNKKITDCRDEEFIIDLFGSVSEFARQVEELGNQFEYNGIQITYDKTSDIHTFSS